MIDHFLKQKKLSPATHQTHYSAVIAEVVHADQGVHYFRILLCEEILLIYVILYDRRCVRRRKSKTRSSSDGNISSGYDSSGSAGNKCLCNHAEVGGGGGSMNTERNTASNAHLGVRGGVEVGVDMGSVLRDGRVQALIEGLWTKVVSWHIHSIHNATVTS